MPLIGGWEIAARACSAPRRSRTRRAGSCRQNNYRQSSWPGSPERVLPRGSSWLDLSHTQGKIWSRGLFARDDFAVNCLTQRREGRRRKKQESLDDRSLGYSQLPLRGKKRHLSFMALSAPLRLCEDPKRVGHHVVFALLVLGQNLTIQLGELSLRHRTRIERCRPLLGSVGGQQFYVAVG